MTFTTRQCVGAQYHSPRFSETDRHHVYPKYLCSLLGVPYRNETVDLCAQCHDNVHHVLHHLINTGTPVGHRLPTGAQTLVMTAWAWWQEQMTNG